MVQWFDDCVKYHLVRFAIANLVWDAIVIPHTRRALEYREAFEKTGSW
jgi:hypothetical protein